MYLPKGEIKRRVLLPNSVQDWESARKFFRMNMHHNANIEEQWNKRGMQSKTYNYFLETHGSAKDSKKNLLDTNYRSMFKNELKKQLKTLKKWIPQPKGEITYISKLLWHKLKNTKRRLTLTTKQNITKTFGSIARKF